MSDNTQWCNRVAHSLYQELSGDKKGKVKIMLTSPHTYVPSTTTGHGHLVITADKPKHEFVQIMSLLNLAGVIERGYLYFTVAKGYSAIRIPGIKKTNKEIAEKKASKVKMGKVYL